MKEITTPTETSFFDYFIYCLKNPFLYKGRARRSEYWGFCLYWFIATIIGLLFIISFIFSFHNIDDIFDNNISTTIFFIFFILYIVIQLWFSLAYYAVKVRRFHDLNFSGWWIVLQIFIDYILPILLILTLYFIESRNIQTSQYISILINKLKDNNDRLTIFIPLLIFYILPYLLMIIYFILTLLKGTRGSNKYGEDPLQLDKK